MTSNIGEFDLLKVVEQVDINRPKLLESCFKERIGQLRNLTEITEEKRKKIKSDTNTRLYYTNNSVSERHRQLNGEGSPPLLLRQYGRILSGRLDEPDEHTEYLEAKNNLQLEYNKLLIELCTFKEEEIKYIIEHHIDNISVKSGFPIFCDIQGVAHTVKYLGDISPIDKRKFFFTRFIIEDTILPIFDHFSFTGGLQSDVFLTIEDSKVAQQVRLV